ncbi:RodZ domain-containing protein [Zymobacter palmae]|uniref:Uncharacterized protein conserved in bacteria n=1 Tax=Zymobacter palmae TaxID=33074 RepID=A0A348HHK5_9GAMM|nr:RodZ domain-containing protein [Zymobacter palmae]BBG31107.1 uncharacterized protein conserved in bacteria [Zymobacter palmae]
MSEQSAPSSPQLSAGQLLRRAREQQQLGIEQVAARLNLRPSLITDIEADNYDHLQIVAYRRGYLRAYARLLKLSEAEVTAAHDRDNVTTQQKEPHRPAPIRPIKRPSRFGRVLFRIVTLAIIVALAIMTLNWWRTHQDVDDKRTPSTASDIGTVPLSGQPIQPVTPPAITPAEQPAAPAMTPAPAPTVPQEDSLQVPVSQGINGAQLTENSAAAMAQNNALAQEASSAGGAATTTAPAPAAAPLALSCRQDCWIQIRDAEGTSLQSGLLKAGTPREFAGKAPYRIVIGNVAAATLSYQGKPVDLKQYARGGNVARFNLGQ